MKVLHLINSLEVGGAENLLVESLPFYKNVNIKVDVAILSSKNAILKKSLENNFDGQLYELGTGSVYNPFVIFKIIKLISKFDIVHIHLFPALYFVVIANYLNFNNTKLVYTEHSTNNKRRNNYWLKIIDKFIYKKLEKIITISNDVDVELRNHIGQENIVLIENGINLKKFIESKSYDKDMFFDIDDKIIIQVSSFRYPKDQKTLIKSLEFLPDKYKLLLVGIGPMKDECETLVKELGFTSRVKFLGLRNDIPQLLKTSDSIVLSSKYEGLSLSSIEGMITGKPFIASNVKGLRDLVVDNGLLFEYGNASHLANQIQLSIEDIELREKLIVACQQKAHQYDINNMVINYSKVYLSIFKK